MRITYAAQSGFVIWSLNTVFIALVSSHTLRTSAWGVFLSSGQLCRIDVFEACV